MKKIIFGSASAILAVVGFSAFKSAKTSTTTYYWFTIDNNTTTKGAKPSLENSTAAFANVVASTVSPSNAACNHTSSFQCLVGFTADQIFTTTRGGKVLDTLGVDPTFGLIDQPVITSPTASQYVKS